MAAITRRWKKNRNGKQWPPAHPHRTPPTHIFTYLVVGECLHAPLRACPPAAFDIRHQSPPPAPIGDDLPPPLPSYSVLSRPPARRGGVGRGRRRTALHYPAPHRDLAVHPGPPHTAPNAVLSLALCPLPTSPSSSFRYPSPPATVRPSPAPREREPPSLPLQPAPPPPLPMPQKQGKRLSPTWALVGGPLQHPRVRFSVSRRAANSAGEADGGCQRPDRERRGRGTRGAEGDHLVDAAAAKRLLLAPTALGIDPGAVPR